MSMNDVEFGAEWDYDNSDDDADVVCDAKPWPEPHQLLEAAHELKLPERELDGDWPFGYEEFVLTKYDFPTVRDLPDYDPEKRRVLGYHWDCNHDLEELGDTPVDKPQDEVLDDDDDLPEGCAYLAEEDGDIAGSYLDAKDKRLNSITLEDDAPQGTTSKNGFVLSLSVKYAREAGQVFIDDPPDGHTYFFSTVYPLPYENVHLLHGQLIRRNPTRACRYKKVYPLCPRKIRVTDSNVKL